MLHGSVSAVKYVFLEPILQPIGIRGNENILFLQFICSEFPKEELATV